MENFYEEHKGYIEMKKKLEHMGRADLVIDLSYIVSDAINYGLDKMAETWKKSSERWSK